jgi:hypothetical protein
MKQNIQTGNTLFSYMKMLKINILKQKINLVSIILIQYIEF